VAAGDLEVCSLLWVSGQYACLLNAGMQLQLPLTLRVMKTGACGQFTAVHFVCQIQVVWCDEV
jgi:hypothetical protein